MRSTYDGRKPEPPYSTISDEQERIAALEAELALAQARARDHHTTQGCITCMAMESELAECKAKLAEAEERLKPIGYHDVDEFYRDDPEEVE